MSRFWEKFFYVATFVLQGSSFLNPRAYAIMHRMHHAFSDTAKDPHSPHFFRNVFAMMHQTARQYHDFVFRIEEPAKEFDGNYPEWPAFDRFTDLWPVRILWGTLYSCFYLYFVTNLWLLVLLPMHWLMGPIHGAIVNWCGHKYGYRNFQNGDRSRNTIPVDIILLGELYQNNHHKFPNRPNFAVRWFELDPVYPVMWTLNLLRIIRLRPKMA
jgi:stearoyl-CoA desaturase (delta-9 desaturase)